MVIKREEDRYTGGKRFLILFAYCLKMLWRKSNQGACRSEKKCSGSGFRWAKMSKKSKKGGNVLFRRAGCSLLRAAGFSSIAWKSFMKVEGKI